MSVNTGNILFWFIGSACILASFVVLTGVMNNLESGALSPESADMWGAVMLSLALVMLGGWMWIGCAVGIVEDGGDDWDEMDDDTPGGPVE
ncbi:MAG: hypothetical protein QGG50_08710 [Methanopyri archaeon]|jgi:hypothetical protein|nr:hypothetical protein [Methanopyri archaeon]